MTIEMIPLNRLRPSKDNPRKSFDEESIKGLAQSILADGLLQNLVAAKPIEGKRKYDIISGERRFRAFTLLVEQGHFPKGRIRSRLTTCQWRSLLRMRLFNLVRLA